MFKDLNDQGPDRSLTVFGIKWYLWLLAAAVVVAAGAFVYNWVVLPLRITGEENVRKQWTWAYTQYEALQATAQQVCSAEKAVNSAASDTERTQRNTQLFAYENNYARLAGEYDARMRNAFEAGLVRPPDLPANAPTLTDMKLNSCQQ
jgi:hypothetical protein